MSDTKQNSSSKLQKISMNVTERDLENVNYLIEELGERSQANVVSKALSVTKELVLILKEGNKIIIEDKEGSLREIKFIGL